MAAKSIKLKCVEANAVWDLGRMYKATINDNGEVWVRCDSGKQLLNSKLETSGHLAPARFIHLKTKTLKCMRLVGAQKAGTFKAGKRYQVESGRALGAVAGYIFDESGEPWTLYRESVGFSCACALFEAKYL